MYFHGLEEFANQVPILLPDVVVCDRIPLCEMDHKVHDVAAQGK